MLAGVAFVTVLLTSAVLVLWGRDDKLEAKKLKHQDDRAWLSDRKYELDNLLAEKEGLREEEAGREAALRERNRPTTKRCPYCREVISIRARKCPRCAEYLDPQSAEGAEHPTSIRESRRF